MHTIKKTISVPEELVKEASEITSNFSTVVEAALVAYLHHYRLQKAVASFGKWEERKDTSVNLVNDLRREDNRKYADRTDRH